METKKETTATAPQSKAVAMQKNVCEKVLARVNRLEQDKQLVLPANYAVENHLKAAWLILQEAKNKNGAPVLSTCTEPSIANSLLDMVIQGLSASKKQCYFVAYGDKLQLMRSYFGTVALAKRTGKIVGDPVANVVYEGDDFMYEIEPSTGLIRIVRHVQKMENIDLNKIIGAYAVIRLADGRTQVTVMSIQQIKNSWAQGAAKGISGAHTKFTDEMCKKTVISRACKMIVNSSDDAWLYEDKHDEMDAPAEKEERNDIVAGAASEGIIPDDVEYEDVTNAPAAPAQAPQQPEQPQEDTTSDDGLFGDAPY